MPVYVCVCVGEVCLRTFQFGQVALIKCLIYQQSSRLLHWESLLREYIFIFSNFPGIKSSHLFRLISQQNNSAIPWESWSIKQVTKVLSILNAIHRVFAGSLNPPPFAWLNICCRSFSLWYFIAARWKIVQNVYGRGGGGGGVEARVGCLCYRCTFSTWCTFSECGSSRVYAQFPNCVIDLFEFTTERKSTWFYDVIELKSTNKGSQSCFNWKYFQLSFDTLCMWWTETSDCMDRIG